jgi:hypothetical protein
MAQGISLIAAPAIAAIDVSAALKAVAFGLFDLKFSGNQPRIPMGAAVGSIAAHVVLALGVTTWRLRAAQRTGVGGSG